MLEKYSHVPVDRVLCAEHRVRAAGAARADLPPACTARSLHCPIDELREQTADADSPFPLAAQADCNTPHTHLLIKPGSLLPYATEGIVCVSNLQLLLARVADAL